MVLQVVPTTPILTPRALPPVSSMAFVFDNLIAILVGTTLLVALVFVQQRGQQSAVDAAVRYQAQSQTSGFLDGLERDVENMRAMAEMDATFGTRRLAIRRAIGADGETYTRQFAFPTLLDPEAGVASDVAFVTYEVTPTGQSVRLGDALHPTYQAVRYVYTRGAAGHVADGGSGLLIDFDVEVTGADNVAIVEAPALTETPQSVHLAVVAAPAGAPQRAGDQRATGATPTRHARTVPVPSAWAVGGSPPVDTTAAAGLPALPGEASAVVLSATAGS